MNDIKEIFRGKKTYIVGILFILLGIIQGDTALILTGLGFMGLKAAVVKTIR